MDETSPLNKRLENYSDGEIRKNIYPKSGKIHNIALPLHVRHVIHHPFGKNKFNDDDLKKSIKILNRILSDK